MGFGELSAFSTKRLDAFFSPFSYVVSSQHAEEAPHDTTLGLTKNICEEGYIQYWILRKFDLPDHVTYETAKPYDND